VLKSPAYFIDGHFGGLAAAARRKTDAARAPASHPHASPIWDRLDRSSPQSYTGIGPAAAGSSLFVTGGGILPTQLATSGDTAATGPSYRYKPSLVGASWTFDLTDSGLSWRMGSKSGAWPYATIAAIRLSYRPISMQSRRFRADISNVSGKSIRILSVNWQTAALVAPQDEPYRTFVRELHRRVAADGGAPVLIAGLGRITYALAGIAMALVGLALAALFIRAAMIGSYGGMLFLAGFAALFGWQLGGFMRRNKPRHYAAGDVPRDLLP
jgi:hypothetical protein